MFFEYPLQTGILIKRYKRFLADIETDSGMITAHCPNTGSMKGCAEPGSKVWYWDSKNPKRKYPHSWELVKNLQGDMIGINTGRANHLVKEAIINNVFPQFSYNNIRTEVSYGKEKSRIDILLETQKQNIWIEVKNVTLLGLNNSNRAQGYFPDSVTTRGSKHLRELMLQIQAGDRAVLIFCVQHSAIESVMAADHIDPIYAQTLKEAAKAGVEILAAKTIINENEIKIVDQIPVILS